MPCYLTSTDELTALLCANNSVARYHLLMLEFEVVLDNALWYARLGWPEDAGWWEGASNACQMSVRNVWRGTLVRIFAGIACPCRRTLGGVNRRRQPLRRTCMQLRHAPSWASNDRAARVTSLRCPRVATRRAGEHAAQKANVGAGIPTCRASVDERYEDPCLADR